MGRVLTIDQGNSSAKAVVWQDGVPVESLRFFHPTVEDLLPLFEKGNFQGCAFCSVGSTDAKFLESLRRLASGILVAVTPTVPLPIGIAYGSRPTLGADRIAACAGAADLWPGTACLVADCGTAMTLDVVDSQGVFRGGNIAPGLSLRFRSLNEATAALPLVGPLGDVPPFGTDTQTAIRSGVMEGMASEIAGAFQSAQTLYSVSRLVLTGNDAPLLAPLIERKALAPELQPELVGRGLLAIFNFNQTQHRADSPGSKQKKTPLS